MEKIEEKVMINIAIPQKLINKIDDYQFGNKIPKRTIAIRRLIRTGLGGNDSVIVKEIIKALNTRHDMAGYLFRCDPKDHFLNGAHHEVSGILAEVANIIDEHGGGKYDV